MNISQYDALLSQCRSTEDWQRFPYGDVVVYSIFGTMGPSVLRRQHRFISCSPDCFAAALSALGVKAALLRRTPRTLAAAPPDYGLKSSISEEAEAWKIDSNQKWLNSQVMNLKFASSRSLIYDANLNYELISLLQTQLGECHDSVKWFKSVDELVDKCRWIYVSLPEMVDVDLLVFGKQVPPGIIRKIDGMGFTSEANWNDDIASFVIRPPEIIAIDKSIR